MQTRAAVFLDRDGVVIEEVHYLSSPSQVRLLGGAAKAIARLNRLAIPVVVVTNQAGVAHGYFPESRIDEVHARLNALLAEHGARVDCYEYCPHHPDAAMAEYRVVCECRKPAPGMLLRAAAACGLDLPRSWLVGDKLSDLEAGLRAGCRVVLVRTGYGRQTEASLDQLAPARVPVAADLAEAVDKCLDLKTSMGKAELGTASRKGAKAQRKTERKGRIHHGDTKNTEMKKDLDCMAGLRPTLRG
jgi:D-glycero-D-manno-heptose 1,7-bisphosphate phosphatase